MGYYKNFDELYKRVTKLTLPQYGKINCCNIVRLYKIDPVHENPVFDIFVSDTFNFVIWVFEWCLPTYHWIYKNYNSSVKNFAVSNLMKVLSNFYRVCEEIKNQQVLSYCTQHFVFEKSDSFVNNN